MEVGVVRQVVDYIAMKDPELTAAYEAHAELLHPEGIVKPIHRLAMADALHLMVSLDTVPAGNDALFASEGSAEGKHGVQTLYVCRPFADPHVVFYLELGRVYALGSVWETGLYRSTETHWRGQARGFPWEYREGRNYQSVIVSAMGSGVVTAPLMVSKVHEFLRTPELTLLPIVQPQFTV